MHGHVRGASTCAGRACGGEEVSVERSASTDLEVWAKRALSAFHWPVKSLWKLLGWLLL